MTHPLAPKELSGPPKTTARERTFRPPGALAFWRQKKEPLLGAIEPSGAIVRARRGGIDRTSDRAKRSGSCEHGVRESIAGALVRAPHARIDRRSSCEACGNRPNDPSSSS